MKSNGFFALGPTEWEKACELGLNPAVAFLVLARGTGRDNVTTRWSAEAVQTHTGMAWRRAAESIGVLEKAKLASNATQSGKRPIRKLAFPKDLDSALWLPNALVTGVGNEVPPIARFRQAQNLEHLHAFIELYGLHDLAGDGGLPRKLVQAKFKRAHICELGQFTVHGFTRADSRQCWATGPLARFPKRKDGEDSDAWVFLQTLERMGLLETVDHLAEGESPDAELIHALTGDPEAENVRDAAAMLAASLPGGFQYEAEQFDYVLPVMNHIATPAVVGVSRLVYRPHTKLTSAWWAQHCESCKRFTATYDALTSGDYQRAAVA